MPQPRIILGQNKCLIRSPSDSSTFTWNTHFRTSPLHRALPLYTKMLQANTPPNKFTFNFLIKSCTKTSKPHFGLHLHCHLIKFGFGSDAFLQSALIGVYAEAGLVKIAEKLFDKMSHRDIVSWTAMVSAYAKLGLPDKAHSTFHKMPERNAVSWAAVVTAYSQSGRHEEALMLFEKMRASQAHLNPTEGMLISVLSSAAHVGALEVGKWVYQFVKRNGCTVTASIGTALLNMFAKCGCIDDALNIFWEMPWRDALCWTAMISALSMHGKGKQALDLFDQMLTLGLRPDHVTFVGVLSACSHAGFIDEGRYYFRCIKEVYKIEPRVEHYGCMAGILGRGGHVEEAWNLVKNMPMKPDVFVLKSLLSACASYGYLDYAEWATKKLIQLDQASATPYILLGNAYANVGRWADAEKVRKMMRVRRAAKTPGHSYVEVDGLFYQFVAGNYDEQPKIEEIKSMLHGMSKILRLEYNTSS